MVVAALWQFIENDGTATLPTLISDGPADAIRIGLSLHTDEIQRQVLFRHRVDGETEGASVCPACTPTRRSRLRPVANCQEDLFVAGFLGVSWSAREGHPYSGSAGPCYACRG